jgi:hypothetical protein
MLACLHLMPIAVMQHMRIWPWLLLFTSHLTFCFHFYSFTCALDGILRCLHFSHGFYTNDNATLLEPHFLICSLKTFRITSSFYLYYCCMLISRFCVSDSALHPMQLYKTRDEKYLLDLQRASGPHLLFLDLCAAFLAQLRVL